MRVNLDSDGTEGMWAQKLGSGQKEPAQHLERAQEVQATGCQINKLQGCEVQHREYGQ